MIATVDGGLGSRVERFWHGMARQNRGVRWGTKDVMFYCRREGQRFDGVRVSHDHRVPFDEATKAQSKPAFRAVALCLARLFCPRLSLNFSPLCLRRVQSRTLWPCLLTSSWPSLLSHRLTPSGGYVTRPGEDEDEDED